MATEKIGNYQLHLLAYELPGDGQWDPFVTIDRFDEARSDFVRVVDRRHAAEKPLPTYDLAIEAARRFGTQLVESNTL
ncbi:MAG: hypothetical protein JWR21_1899 [Herminiimonas sp.]|nr:hypothetical protein [Herminiimonas sp.]MDB5854880.1 hypothetical protein [Herminiimonas sp.]